MVNQNHLQSLYEQKYLKVKAECKYKRIIDSPYEGHPYVMRIPVVKLKHDFDLNKCRNCGEIDNPHLNRGEKTPQREYHRQK